MTTYEVIVTREDNLWVADVQGLPPHLVGATDVEHFADLDVEVRDLVAGLTDTDPDGITIRWRYEVNGIDVTDKLTRFPPAESPHAICRTSGHFCFLAADCSYPVPFTAVCSRTR